MGGLAFASGPGAVFTPRMKPTVYRAVRDRCQARLRELFVVVATPIEGPAKTSYGDIDLFLAWPREDVFPLSKPTSSGPCVSLKDTIYQTLGVIRCKSEHEHTATMAIPWPGDISYPDVESGTEYLPQMRKGVKGSEEQGGKDRNSADDLGPPCVQVDIHICKTLDHLQWMLFKHAHGDLWNLLGSTIRPFGLTVDEEGLYLRIPEIEDHDKKKAKILLSTDPSEILGFLGLKFDNKQWEEPFTSDQDIFEYAATCRLFWAKPLGIGPGADMEDEGKEIDRCKLKANDRRRMEFRPLFRKWIEEFLPACRASGRFASASPTRDAVRQQAFEYFPGTQPIYGSRLTAWRVERQQLTLWKDVIKPAVPLDLDGHRRGCCTSALRKIILRGDDSFNGIMAPPTLRDGESGFFDEGAVRAWVEDNWQRVSDVAWNINLQRMEHKGSLKRTASGSEKSAAAAAAAATDGDKVPLREKTGDEPAVSTDARSSEP